MERIDRSLILVVGESPLDLVPFKQRDLNVRRVTLDVAPKYLWLPADFVADFSDKFGLIRNCYAALFPHAEDHGLAQAVIVDSQADLASGCSEENRIQQITLRIFLIGEIWRRRNISLDIKLGHLSEMSSSSLIAFQLSDDDQLLLRRAFSDCEPHFLDPLVGGKASTGVFCAHAWLRQSQVGPRPLPFFVKIGTPRLVNEEKSNYGLYAEHYIPFDLWPNLDLRRCVCTRAKAALVGNFVDDAVPLRRSLRSGHGVGALFALFETSLKGFRLQPFAANEKQRGACARGVCKKLHSV